MLRVLLSRVRATLRRSRLDDELDEELREHLALLQERFVRNGMAPSEAFYAARRQFGGVAQVKERVIERRSMPLAEDVARDVRHAARGLWHSPGFSLAAIVSLAVGIAAATGLFSIVNAALLNPFPFADINRIVRLDMIDKGKPHGLFVTARQLVALQHSDVLEGAFASNNWEMTLTGQDLPETVPTQYFSANG
jgi:hypothetical protein